MVHNALERCMHKVKAHGVNHILVQADVSREGDIMEMVAEVIEKLGGVDVLINNAGIHVAGDSHEIEIGAFDRVLAVNLRGAYEAAPEAMKHFLAEEKQGSIVNISSVHEIIPKPRHVGYSVSKGALVI
jgi:glucose 1-dehydrogenase